MIPTLNAYKPFFSPFAGALGTLVLSDASVLLGVDGLRLVAQMGSVDKASITDYCSYTVTTAFML